MERWWLVAWGLRSSVGWIAVSRRKIFRINIHYLDCGGGFSGEYIALKMSTCTFSHILYSDYTSILFYEKGLVQREEVQNIIEGILIIISLVASWNWLQRTSRSYWPGVK